MIAENIVSIYEDVLAGNRKSFPNHTWTRDNYGFDNFSKCLRHIARKLKFDREQIIAIDHEFIAKYKLRGGMVQLYDDSLQKAIINVFPELNIKRWEFFRTPKDEEFVKIALREIIQEKGWTRENFLENRSRLYEDEDIRKLTDWLIRNGYAIVPFLKDALPEYNFTTLELRQRINKEKVKEEIKHIFEDVLKWTEKDIEEKMTREIALEYFSKPYSQFRNTLDMVRSVYPDIFILKSMKMPLSEEAKKRIITDVRAGKKTKEITSRYGIGRNTLYILKKEHGLIKEGN